MLTVTEAAKLLGVSRRTLDRMLADGRLRAVRSGRIVRVPESSLLELGLTERDVDREMRKHAAAAQGTAAGASSQAASAGNTHKLNPGALGRSPAEPPTPESAEEARTLARRP